MYDNIRPTYAHLNAVWSWFWYLEIFGFCHLDADSGFASLRSAAHFVVQEIFYRMVSGWTSKTQSCRWHTPLESWEIDRFPSILGVENAKHQEGDRKMHCKLDSSHLSKQCDEMIIFQSIAVSLSDVLEQISFFYSKQNSKLYKIELFSNNAQIQGSAQFSNEIL